MSRKPVTESADMGGEFAAQLRARMERLDISDAALARQSREHDSYVNRETIGAIKAGQGFQHSTRVKLENVLGLLEHEMGLDPWTAADEVDGEEQAVEFEVQLPGEHGATVVVRGPDAEEAVARLLRRLRSDESSS